MNSISAVKDHWFNNHAAAENFLRNSGFSKKDVDYWVSSSSTAKISPEGERFKVFIRRRMFIPERVR